MARISQINLDEHERPVSAVVHLDHDEGTYLSALVEREGGAPVTVRPEGTLVDLAELIYLTRLTGRQDGISAEEVMPGGDTLNVGIYECLTGTLFYRFYDDGVDEAGRAVG